jgi:uncharacterized membrane protein YtjA (UPF0391 family)
LILFLRIRNSARYGIDTAVSYLDYVGSQVRGEIEVCSIGPVFLIIAIIAAVFGFGGIAGTAAGIAKILFIVGIILFLIFLVFGSRRRL